MATIMVKQKEGAEWTKIHQGNYPDEAYLQNLIYNDPSLIPVKDIGENLPGLKVIIKEAGLPGSGSTDLIGIDETGTVTIVECKLAKSVEVKRKVIGQVLEYAAFLWHMSYEDFDQIVKNKLGKSLVDVMEEKIEDENWLPDDFIKDITNTLDKGTFRLIIAVDQINNELKKTVQYLNSHSGDFLEIYLLELNYFSDGRQKIIVPQIFGIAERPKTSEGRRIWKEKEVLKDCEDRNSREVYQRIQEIHEFGKKEFGEKNFSLGTGVIVGSITYFLLKDSKRISFFTIRSDGKVTLNLGELKNHIPEDRISEFVDNINEIEGLQIAKDFSKWPNIDIKRCLLEETNMKIFEGAVLNLTGKIKKT